MAFLRTLTALVVGAGLASSFAPTTQFAKKNVVAFPRTETSLNVFSEAMKDWESKYPQFAKWGWGPSVQAEKWNGRHAMFGWLFICATAYAKGHGLIPDADVPLDLKEWGTLAIISGKTTITNERAIILIANVHCFFVGVASTIAPLPFTDPLLLDPGQSDAEPYGVIPAVKFGLTPEAEMFNGRLAMLGIICLLGASAILGKPMLDIVNEGVGGLYF